MSRGEEAERQDFILFLVPQSSMADVAWVLRILGGVVRVPQGYALSCYPMYVYNTGNIEQGPKPYVIVKRQSVESPIFYSAVTVAHCFLWGAWPGANFCCVWSPLCHDLLRSCQDWPLHLRNFHSWSLETACLAGDLAGPSHYLY